MTSETRLLNLKQVLADKQEFDIALQAKTLEYDTLKQDFDDLQEVSNDQCQSAFTSRLNLC